MKFSDYLNTIGEYGMITEVKHPLVTVEGLPKAKPHEIVYFETGEMGQVFSLEKEHIVVLVFSPKSLIVGTKAVRTDEFLKVPVGKELLGKTINSLGEELNSSLASSSASRPKETRDVEILPKPIHERVRIKEQLTTGITLVDLMIPIGKGQKELILGDRKTGKSSLVLSTLKNQVKEGTIAIYAAIARKQSDIKKTQEFLQENNLMDKTILVASSSNDAPSYIYITPYTAMTIAEYYCEQGLDVLVILDDLSTHAKFYREIALLARRFPGRDSYPGDIFYTHARLLERSGNFKISKKSDSRGIENEGDMSEKEAGSNKGATREASITCLPIIETTEGDLTGFIPTNIMGMTDGHIFFDSNIYYKGRRPAINLELSVTRVGRQTQTPLQREVSQNLSSFLNEYEKMQNYSHFGAELSGKVKSTLLKGELIYTLFNQSHEHFSTSLQLVLFALIWGENLTTEQSVIDKKKELLELYEKDPKTYDDMIKAENIYELVTNVKKLFKGNEVKVDMENTKDIK